MIFATYEELLYKVFGIFIKSFRESIIEMFDFLPRKVLGKTLEGEPTSYHLVNHTPKSPKIGATDLYKRNENEAWTHCTFYLFH